MIIFFYSRHMSVKQQKLISSSGQRKSFLLPIFEKGLFCYEKKQES